MRQIPPLSETQLQDLLTQLPAWRVENGHLAVDYTFTDFKTAFAFLTQVALAAEQMDHHPDWSNSYNRVNICLFTHDQQSLTELDARLAKQIAQFAALYPSK